jgi:hypothetical protein
MDIHILDKAIFVNDKNGPLGFTIITENTVLLGNFSMRPEITDQRIGYTANVFCPRF